MRIRKNKWFKSFAVFMAVNFFYTAIVPNALMANNTGPIAPESTSFESVEATDLVNLLSGDLSYVLPLLNVPGPEGGYPVTLSYHSGIPLNLESSWVGLGWNINPGALNRGVNGLPDDWKNKKTYNIIKDAGGSSTTVLGSALLTVPMQGGAGSVGIGLSFKDGKATGGIVSLSVALGQETTSQGDKVKGSYSNSASLTLSTTGYAKVGIGPVSIDNQGTVGAGYFSLGFSLQDGFSGGGVLSATSGFQNIPQSVSEQDFSQSITRSYSSIDMGFFRYDEQIITHEYSLYNEMEKYNSGTIYHDAGKDYNEFNYGGAQSSKFSTDTYNIPTNSSQTDYDLMKNSTSLMFLDYDNYSISAQGVNGSIKPRYYKTVNIVAEGNVQRNKIPLGGTNFLHKNVSRFYADNGENFNRTPQNIFFSFDGIAQGHILNEPGYTTNYTTNNHNPLQIGEINYQDHYVTSTGQFVAGTTDRKIGGKYVEWFTNDEIINNNSLARSKGFIETSSIVSNDPLLLPAGGHDYADESRLNPKFFDPDGIGAFNITSEDGVTYHYSLPVYQFEEWSRTYENGTQVYFENRKLDKYAFTWLLTSVTGPDYIDKNNNGMVDEDDYGYWVDFQYGKHSDAFAWRLPASGLENNSFSYGIKQKYYLNHIKTRTHTAYFVKDARDDGVGFSIGDVFPGSPKVESNSMNFTNFPLIADRPRSNIFGETPCPGQSTITSFNNYFINTISSTTSTVVDTDRSLKLSKIILVKNEDATLNYASSGRVSISTSVNSLSVDFAGYYQFNSNKVSQFATGGSTYNSCVDYKRYFYRGRDNLVLDEQDVLGTNIQGKALKIIEFTQDYSLNKASFGNPTAQGKLTLKELQIKGANGINSMPSYQFSYITHDDGGQEYTYHNDRIDNWGFLADNASSLSDENEKNDVDAWSLKEIITPVGSKMRFNYESDVYHSEAINANNENGGNLYFTRMKKIIGTNNYELFFEDSDYNLKNWFKEGNGYNFHFPSTTINCSSGCATQPPSTPVSLPNVSHGSFSNNLIVTAVNKMSIVVDGSTVTQPVFIADFINSGFYEGSFYYYSNFTAYAQTHGYGIKQTYYGGGLRVNSVDVEDELGNIYRTKYSYNNGITSFAPRAKNYRGGERYVPYNKDIPAPGVMYGEVSVEAVSLNGDRADDKMEYQFEILEPSTNTNSHNFAMGKHFSVKNQTPNNAIDFSIFGYTTTNNGINIWEQGSQRTAIITDKTAHLGRLLSVKKIDKKDMISSEVLYDYLPYNITTTTSKRKLGVTQESFKYISRTRTDAVHYDGYNPQWHLPVVDDRIWKYVTSSRLTVPSVLSRITTRREGQVYSTTYSDFDINTGKPQNIEYQDSYANKYKSLNIPAYLVYSGMGSKIYDIDNKNMMVQEVSNYLYRVEDAEELLLSASVQTWKNNWSYREFDSPTNQYILAAYTNEVWRKHKTYTWKGLLASDGTYRKTGVDAFVPFNFNPGGGLDDNWKKVNEITLYDHYSHSLESKDIVGKYASSKMGYNDSRIISSVINAKYTDFTYSGAESQVIDQFFPTNYLSGEVKLGSAAGHYFADNFTAGDKYVHTGKGSVMAKPFQQGGFLYENSTYDVSRRNKVSVWVHKDNAQYSELKVQMKSGASTIATYNEVVNATTKKANDWYLLEINVPSSIDNASLVGVTSVEVETLNSTTGSEIVYYDDLMVHPVTAPMTSYVYDDKTGLVTAIINNNGLAVKYKYDDAGRLTTSYTEIINKGFVKTAEYDYNYARQ